MKLAHRIAGVLVAALLLAACDTRESHHVPRSTEPYQRWEAPGRYGGMSGPRNVYWIDNDRLLYVGTDEDDSTYANSTLRIWTLSTGKVEKLGPSSGATSSTPSASTRCGSTGTLQRAEIARSTGRGGVMALESDPAHSVTEPTGCDGTDPVLAAFGRAARGL